MLFQLAWRNIWRNRRRSYIVMTSIIVGLVSIILMDTLSIGMITQMLDNQIGSHITHIQIHKKGFHDNKIIQNLLPDSGPVEKAIQNTPGITDASPRVISFGLLSSAANSTGIYLVGVEPETEQKITNTADFLVEGRYLNGKPHEIVIGLKLAEKLNVGLDDKVVALASARDGTVGSDVFRVVGIFQSPSSGFDKTTILIPIGNAQTMLSLGSSVSEFAMLVEDPKQLRRIKQRISAQLDDRYEVLTYEDILPLLVMQVDMYKEIMVVFYLIVGIAMIFGIVNTMLMSVFERVNEIGVLMAIGMRNSRIFGMIITEALMLAICGTILGTMGGLLVYWPLSETGIDFSIFSESLTAFGIGAIVRPVLTLESVMNSILVIPVISVLAATYPAYRAIRLEPIYAIRHV